MKKIVLITSLFIFVFLVLIILTKEASVDLEITYVDTLETSSKNRLKVCMLREDGKLVLIDVEKKNNEFDYLYVLKLYDHYRNALPLTYTTPLKGNFEIKKLEQKKDQLEIELEVLYLVDNFHHFLTALMWSYQELGINAITVKANNEIFHLKRNTKINPKLETMNNIDIEAQLILYQDNEVLLPITYYHDQDKVYFLLDKLIGHYPEVQADYKVYTGMIILDISDPKYELSQGILESLGLNLENLDYLDIIIIKNNLIVYHN